MIPVLSEIASELLEYNPEPRGKVYFVCDGDRVVYVGQTRNIGYRYAQHQSWIIALRNPRVVYINVSEDRLDAVEKYWIKKLLPERNGTHARKQSRRVPYETICTPSPVG